VSHATPWTLNLAASQASDLHTVATGVLLGRCSVPSKRKASVFKSFVEVRCVGRTTGVATGLPRYRDIAFSGVLDLSWGLRYRAGIRLCPYQSSKGNEKDDSLPL